MKHTDAGGKNMLTPLDIEAKVFKKVPMGYSATEVDKFLKEVLSDYENIYKENIELKDKINILNDGVQHYKTMETTLQNTLILAEKTAEETKVNAHAKSEQMIREAEIKVSELMLESQKEINRLNQKIEFLKNQFELSKTKIKQVLITELEMVLNSKIDIADIEEELRNGIPQNTDKE